MVYCRTPIYFLTHTDGLCIGFRDSRIALSCVLSPSWTSLTRVMRCFGPTLVVPSAFSRTRITDSGAVGTGFSKIPQPSVTGHLMNVLDSFSKSLVCVGITVMYNRSSCVSAGDLGSHDGRAASSSDRVSYVSGASKSGVGCRSAVGWRCGCLRLCNEFISVYVLHPC
jgi:hypothetical protein